VARFVALRGVCVKEIGEEIKVVAPLSCERRKKKDGVAVGSLKVGWLGDPRKIH